MVTIAVDVGQTPLVTVHIKELVPMLSPVMEDENEEGADKVPVPPVIVHKPAPDVGEVAPKMVEVAQTL